MRIRSKLLTGYLLVFLISLLSGYQSYRKSTEINRKAALEKFEIITNYMLNSINSELDHYLDMIDSVAISVRTQKLINSYNPELGIRFINDISERYIDFYRIKYGYNLLKSITLYNSNGDYLTGTDNYLVKPKVRIISKMSIGAIYFDNNLKIHSMPIVYPIFDNNKEIIGFIEAKISVFELIKKAEITTETSYNFEISIISDDNKLLYSSKPYLFMKEFSDLDISNKSKGYLFFMNTINDSTNFLKWKILFKVKQKDMFSELKGLQVFWIFYLSLYVVLMILIAIFITRTITKPIYKLSSFVSTLSEDRYGEQIIFKSNDEVGLLSKVLNRMSVGLRENYDNIIEKNRELDIAKNHAIEANRTKSLFLANMSHEIRTPLNGVVGFTDLLLKTPLTHVQRQYVQNANTSGELLREIINNILDFSKIEAGSVELDIVKTDLFDFVESTVDIISYHASNKNIEFLFFVDHNIPSFIYVDPVKLRQILVNLLSNAIKFTIKGEVEFRVELISSKDNVSEIRFSVRDTGIGISEEHLEKLFKPFIQADSSITKEFGGTGLGLTISEVLVSKMGGVINVDSQLEKGSLFTVLLTFQSENSKPHYIERINLKRALIIDDNENNIIILTDTLKLWGVDVVSCNSGLKAIELVKTESNFDFIMVDYNMPIIDGLETIKRIRNLFVSNNVHVPEIILHSSSDDSDFREKCRALGIKKQLLKPVKSRELYNFLLHLIDQNFEEPTIVQDEHIIVTDKKLKILIAEDILINMELIKGILEEIIPNAIVLEAVNGEEVLNIYKTNQPDFMLLDVQMPLMSGIEATEKIRMYEVEAQKHIPIIALTAGALPEEKQKCLDAGMDDFLTKPISTDELVSALKRYLL